MATREEAVDIAKGIVEAKLGDYYKLSKEHKLASALLALDERVRVLESLAVAAVRLHERAEKCSDPPYMGCGMNHDDIVSALGDEVDAYKALATGEGKEG